MAIIKNPTTVIQVSGGALVESDVNFYDYDGTLLYAYSKNDFLALSSMPSNPSHTGLVAEGWNWSLSDAQTYVTTYGILDIGQTYTTSSGKNEFDIELTSATGLSISLNMDGNKDWGDGITDTNTSHTYSTYGEYTIKCDGIIDNNISSYIMGNSNNYSCKHIRLATMGSSDTFCNFSYCKSVETIIISKTIYRCLFTFDNCINLKTLIEGAGGGFLACGGCFSLKKYIFRSNYGGVDDSHFLDCSGLEKITLSQDSSSMRIYSFAFSNCHLLKTLIIPSNTSSIYANAFSGCGGILLYDFSNVTSIPTLSNTNAFTGINGLCKIVIPDNLYSQWIIASNWSAYADYIYRVSDV